MVIIKNNADKAINVYNDVFFVNIAPNNTAEIGDDILNKNSEFYFVYPGPKEAQTNADCGFDVSEGFLKRFYFKYQIQNIFSIATILNLKNISEIQVKAENVTLRFLTIFKTVSFKKLVADCTPADIVKPHYAFMNPDDKRYFLRLMRFGNAFTFPIGLIAAFYGIAVLFEPEDILLKIFMLLFMLTISIGAFTDVYYTAVARKWDVLDEWETLKRNDNEY